MGRKKAADKGEKNIYGFGDHCGQTGFAVAAHDPAALRPGADGGTVKRGLSCDTHVGAGHARPQRFRKHLLAFKRRG